MTDRLLGASLLVLAMAGCMSYGEVTPPDPQPKIEVVPPTPPDPVPPLPPSIEYVGWENSLPLNPNGTSSYGPCSGATRDWCMQGPGASLPQATPAATSARGGTTTPVSTTTTTSPRSLIREGLGAFLEPKPMVVGVPAELEFAAALSQDDLAREVRGRPTQAARAISVATSLKVSLEPHDVFEIRGPNGLVRPLDARRASWQWVVVPKVKGPYTLRALVEPIVTTTDGREVALPGYSETVDVLVDVSPEQKAAEDHKGGMDGLKRGKEWFEGATGLVLAIAGFIAALGVVAWRVRKFGGKPEATKA